MSEHDSETGLLEDTLSWVSPPTNAVQRYAVMQSVTGGRLRCGRFSTRAVWSGSASQLSREVREADPKRYSTLLRQAGHRAVPLPLAECSLLGGWLAFEEGFLCPEDRSVWLFRRKVDELRLERGRISGVLNRVPWGGHSTGVVALANSSEGVRVVMLDPSVATVTPGWNMAGEPRDMLRWTESPLALEHVGAAGGGLADELALRGLCLGQC